MPSLGKQRQVFSSSSAPPSVFLALYADAFVLLVKPSEALAQINRMKPKGLRPGCLN
jgi:hypothetical protein